MRYCLNCEKVVTQCWGNGMCSGGGHCEQCGGYDFESDEQKELREAAELLDEKLAYNKVDESSVLTSTDSD